MIHTTNDVYKIPQTLGEWENKLGNNFLRVHKSFIANVDQISKIREVSSRSYEIYFNGYDKAALMSRYKFKNTSIDLPPCGRGVIFLVILNFRLVKYTR